MIAPKLETVLPVTTSDTPRTNAQGDMRRGGLTTIFVTADFARQLKRELNECARVLTLANKWIEEAKPLLEKGGKAERDCEQWKQMAEELARCVDDCLNAEQTTFQCTAALSRFHELKGKT